MQLVYRKEGALDNFPFNPKHIKSLKQYHNVQQLKDLEHICELDLLRTVGLGPDAVRTIKEIVEENGYSLRPTTLRDKYLLAPNLPLVSVCTMKLPARMIAYLREQQALALPVLAELPLDALRHGEFTRAELLPLEKALLPYRRGRYQEPVYEEKRVGCR